jgi:hypothetical protein
VVCLWSASPDLGQLQLQALERRRGLKHLELLQPLRGLA